MLPPRQTLTSGAKRSIKGMFSVLLAAYSLILLIAALPNELDIERLRPLRDESRRLLDHIKIRAASAVFAGNRGVWKRKSLCFVVRGTRADGEQSLLYENYPNCKVPDVRLFEDTFYVLLMRGSYGREMKGFLGTSKKKLREEISRLQSNSGFDKASRYFCNSPLALSGEHTFEPKRVDILWEVTQLNYETKQVRADLVHAHSFDCGKNRRDASAYRRLQVARTSTGSLELIARNGAP